MLPHPPPFKKNCFSLKQPNQVVGMMPPPDFPCGMRRDRGTTQLLWYTFQVRPKRPSPKSSWCHVAGKITDTPLQSQYRAQISYSSFVPRNLKSTGTTSWNPSSALGSLNRDTKPLKAILGRAWRASGLSCARVSMTCSIHDFTRTVMDVLFCSKTSRRRCARTVARAS